MPLFSWRRFLRVPWTARRSNQSILKEINTDIHWKNWRWSWSSSTLTTGCKEPAHRKDPDAGKDWRWEEKGKTENEMVGWHHQLRGHEFEQTLGVGDRQGSLVCCSPWGRKESDMTERLNNISNPKRWCFKVLHSICQQIWKTQQCPQVGKGLFSFQFQRKAMPKNVQTTAQLH